MIDEVCPTISVRAEEEKQNRKSFWQQTFEESKYSSCNHLPRAWSSLRSSSAIRILIDFIINRIYFFLLKFSSIERTNLPMQSVRVSFSLRPWITSKGEIFGPYESISETKFMKQERWSLCYSRKKLGSFRTCFLTTGKNEVFLHVRRISHADRSVRSFREYEK